LHGFLEISDPFAQAPAQFRDAARAEDQDDDEEDEEDLAKAQAAEHDFLQETTLAAARQGAVGRESYREKRLSGARNVAAAQLGSWTTASLISTIKSPARRSR